MPRIVLASTSRYRRELLQRLGIPFEVLSPEVDETRQDGESAQELVRRLSEAKAYAGGRQNNTAL
ncbi:MAG: Maf family protein, partial [Gammaproteobacteria bacterium]